MRKHTLLNAPLASVIATLGHTDEVTICDAGLPIPEEVDRIDLALTEGVPGFIATVKAYLSEAQIESVIVAQEFADMSPDLYQALVDVLEEEGRRCSCEFRIEAMPHEAFKERTSRSKAIVRTGECTPYANVIFISGVVF